MIPGELIIEDGEHELNVGRRTMRLVVRNRGDRPDRKSTRLNSSHMSESRMPSSA